MANKPALPPSCPPRGLSHDEAAAYIGIGTTLFDQLVKEGKMPGGIPIKGRRVWDRLALDLAFSALRDAAAGEEEIDFAA